MRGITTFIVLMGLLAIGLLVSIPTMDGIAPLAEQMAPQFSGQISNIHAVTVKWLVPVFFGTIMLWAVFWVLRQERQQV